MKRYYCTYFDENYLLRAMALFESLDRCETSDFEIFAICMDDGAARWLRSLALPRVTPVAMSELEAGDSRLAAAREGRTWLEYYWTATPTIILRLLERVPLAEALTYVDSDISFFSSPGPLFEEMGGGSILIHEHRFWPPLAHFELFGKYNVGLMAFRNDAIGREALEWWREHCLEWCYFRYEDGKLGDQLYLNDWPERFRGVRVLQHPGAGVAPWNVNRYRLSAPGGCRQVDDQPLIFYHFHGFQILDDGFVPAFRYYLNPAAQTLIYTPYEEAIRRALERVRRGDPGFRRGFKTLSAGERFFNLLFSFRLSSRLILWFNRYSIRLTTGKSATGKI